MCAIDPIILACSTHTAPSPAGSVTGRAMSPPRPVVNPVVVAAATCQRMRERIRSSSFANRASTR